jgi:hypothetical protein
MATNYNPSIVSDSLAFLLDAGNVKSYPGTGTSWYDLGPNKYTGSMTAGLTYSSSNGGYINFPGGHYCLFSSITGSVMADPGAFSGITFGLWYYPTSTQASQYVFSSAGGSGQKGFDILLQNSGNADYIRVTSASATYTNTNSVETLNVWQHIMAVWNGSSLITYVNGVNTNVTVSTTVGYGTNADKLSLGCPPSVLGSYTYVGRIAMAFVYSKALSAQEVLQNYNAMRGRYGL